MRRTQFAGLTVLEPGEPLSTDGFSFQQRNPDITDKFLQIGAQTHRHDMHPALHRPTGVPSAAAVPSGGQFPADVTLTFGYTLVDAAGGETLLVEEPAVVTTPPLMPTPADPPAAAFSSAAGSIPIGTYYYVKTWIDDSGGETEASPYAVVERPPGYASGQIELSGLNTGSGAAGAAGWRLYKAGAGGTFHFIASGTADAITDNGTLCASCTDTPPLVNTTNQRNTVQLTMPDEADLPAASAGASAVAFRMYASIVSGFPDPSFLGEFPLASAGQTFNLVTWAPEQGRPPDVATAIGGANKIDPYLELHDWMYQRWQPLLPMPDFDWWDPDATKAYLDDTGFWIYAPDSNGRYIGVGLNDGYQIVASGAVAYSGTTLGALTEWLLQGGKAGEAASRIVMTYGGRIYRGDGTATPVDYIDWRVVGGVEQFYAVVDGQEQIIATDPRPNEQTGNYTLALSDAARTVEMNASGATTLTVPPNGTVALPIGTIIEVARMGTGTVAIAAGAGVTLRSAGGLLNIGNQYGAVSLRKRATNEWVVVGDLA